MNKKHKLMLFTAIIGFWLMIGGVLFFDVNLGITFVLLFVGIITFILGPMIVDEEYKNYE